MDWHNEYTEKQWRSDADARERAAARDEQLQMQDWYGDPVAFARCDGSGILEEFYVDVDQTQVIRCPGCCACEEGELEQARRRAPIAEPAPLWTGADIALRPQFPELEASGTEAA